MNKKILKIAGTAVLIFIIVGRLAGIKTARQAEKSAAIKEQMEEIAAEAALADMTEHLRALEEACLKYRAEHGDWPDGKSALRRNGDYIPPELPVDIKNGRFYFGTNRASKAIYHIHAFPKDGAKKYAGYDGFMLYYFDTAEDGDWETKKYGCLKSDGWHWSRERWPF